MPKSKKKTCWTECAILWLVMQATSINTGPPQEVFSFPFGWEGHNLLAAGCKSKIVLGDWRRTEQIACCEESRVEDVTQVHFVRQACFCFFDGLMCLFDTSGDKNDDDHLISVSGMSSLVSVSLHLVLFDSIIHV
ncbi:hypothetical protein ACP275_04G012000 [Erythranthe tilingii]